MPEVFLQAIYSLNGASLAIGNEVLRTISAVTLESLTGP